MREALIAGTTVSAVLGVVCGLALGAGALFTGSSSSSTDADLAGVWSVMDGCWIEIMAAAPNIEQLDTAPSAVVNAVTRTTLAACGSERAGSTARCDTNGCYRHDSGTGYNWDAVMTSWMEDCWGKPAQTPGCLP